MQGSIPEEYYKLTEVNTIYLNLTSTSSELLVNMTELKNLYLG